MDHLLQAVTEHFDASMSVAAGAVARLVAERVVRGNPVFYGFWRRDVALFVSVYGLTADLRHLEEQAWVQRYQADMSPAEAVCDALGSMH